MLSVIKVSLKLFFQKTCHLSFSRPCRFESLYLETHNPSRLSNSRNRSPVYRKWTGIFNAMIFYINRRSCSYFHLADEVILRKSNWCLGTSHNLRIVILFQLQHRYFLLLFGRLFSIHGMNLLVSFLR